LFVSNGGPYTIEENVIANNKAPAGGGIYLGFVATLDNPSDPNDPSVATTIKRNTISGNTATAARGGGVGFLSATGQALHPLQMLENTVGDNTATGEGGGLYIESCLNLSFSGCTIGNNHVGAGSTTGGVYVNSDSKAISFVADGSCLTPNRIYGNTGYC